MRNVELCLRSSRTLRWFLAVALTAGLGIPSTWAQSNSGQQTIDFENTSGPSVFGSVDPPLTQGVAKFSGGQILTNATFLPVDPTTVYGTAFFCSGCSPTITIDFSQKVSNFSVFLMNGEVFNVTYTVEDDQGGSQVVTLAANFDSGAGTITLPDKNIKQVQISGDTGEFDFLIDNVQFTTSLSLIDPIQSSLLRDLPGGVATDTDILSQVGVLVSGVSADGVTRLIVRIPAEQAGETLNLSVINDLGTSSNSVPADGGVFAIGTDPSTAASSIQLTAVDTPVGPMAFALYIAPTDFSRGAGDFFEANRAIDLQVTANDDPSFQLSGSVQVFRPPIVFVHGLWDRGESWSNFLNNTLFSGFTLRTANYNAPVPGVTATDPSYLAIQLDLSTVNSNALGFGFNAPAVDTQIRQFISDFASTNGIAAVRADVVGHSMGGDVSRTVALGQFFKSADTYGQGPINKLITIGTPHLGSPLATGLLGGNNDCIRRLMATAGNISFRSVTIAGATVSGAVADLQGDGNGGGLSQALSNMRNAPGNPFPTAYIAGIEDQTNLSGLNCTLCKAQFIRTTCGTIARDPLALNLTPTGWPTVFGQDNDSIVPLSSELNQSSGNQFTGVIHSPGVLGLNFNGPTEMDLAAIQSKVLDLLNEVKTGPDFH